MDNKLKSKKLGMSFSTASSKLRKMILFKYVKKLKLNICYHCENKITDIDDFTIEHVKPWQLADNPREAFFDLYNISFSHSRCNFSSGGREAVKNRKSKYIGLSYKKDRKSCWQVYIKNNSISIYVGSYKDEKEAAKAYDKKAVELYGKNCLTNKKKGLL